MPLIYTNIKQNDVVELAEIYHNIFFVFLTL